MKTSRQAKMESQLAMAESELLAALAGALPYTAQHGDGLFHNSELRPEYIQPHHIDSQSERLYQLAKQSVELRDTIGFPVLGSIGQLFISACRESANTSNANRRGPRQLAAWLIGELGA